MRRRPYGHKKAERMTCNDDQAGVKNAVVHWPPKVKKKYYCAADRCRPLCSTREKNLRYYGAKTPSQCRSLCKATSCVCPPTDDREGPAYVGQENTFPGPDSNGLLYSSQTSPDSHWRTIHGVCRSGGNNVPDRINPTLLKDTVTEVVESGFGAGISLGDHTDLHVFHGGTLTGVRYRDEILDPYVRAIGNDFILMDDNARFHRAVVVEDYLEGHGLERMEWPAQSPDLNPIKHLWDYLGRQVAALSPPPRSLDELEQGLLHVRSSFPISVTDSLIDSMESRCRQCIQVRGGHIPYY
ncbi:hypothetical protein AVEN_163975-1 [Araneus ventricosus]|nr:hypothetical protein AVEN_163975-1 [Araneus ventricosus]